jgi:pimeloyl-ACP methyl ester carboxylesterase
MAGCFSFTASGNRCFRIYFASAGMKSKQIELDDGTTMHCWVPKKTSNKPALILIHGLGANAMWQWSSQLRPFRRHFNLYVPDLLFFGRSFTTRPEKTELFQSQCVMKLVEKLGVSKFHVAGVSYGGFVAYHLAHLYPEAVQKVVLIAAGVCLEEKDMKEGLFNAPDLETAISILLPQTAANLKKLLKLSFVRAAPKMVPSCLLQDFIANMVTDRRDERIELINNLIAGRKASDLPVIHQETLIIWGEHDQIFPLELGNRLKRHLGDRAELVLFKDAGHGVHVEKSTKFNSQLKKFLLG